MKVFMVMQNGMMQFDKVIQFLEIGWEIQPPVLSQLVSQRYQQASTVYHFRLHHHQKGQTMVVIVPASLQLQRFFVRHNIDTSDIAWPVPTNQPNSLI